MKFYVGQLVKDYELGVSVVISISNGFKPIAVQNLRSKLHYTYFNDGRYYNNNRYIDLTPLIQTRYNKLKEKYV
jgi:hypothetical protein